MNRPLLLSALILAAFATVSVSPASAQPGDVTLGLNYPGAMIGYRRANWAFELRGQGQNDTTLFGARVSRLFPLANSRHQLYVGVEGGRFEKKATAAVDKATGGVGGAFVGLETFVTRHVSLAVDVGPYYASASDAGESAAVFDFVANASVNFHWRGRP